MDGQPSRMARQYVLDDGKAKPGPVSYAAFLDVYPIEPLSQSRNVFFGNARPEIAEADCCFGAGAASNLQGHLDALALLAIFARVFQKIGEDLDQLVPVSRNDDRCIWRREIDGNVIIFGQMRHGLEKPR